VYKALLRPLLFLFDPEKVHSWVNEGLLLAARFPLVLSILRAMYSLKNKRLRKTVCGIRFSNSVGLAAGFDKNARFIMPLESLGFGFVEIGTLTPQPQPGNEKPRLFRLNKDKALINRMGFNNSGVDSAVQQLKNRPQGLVVGGNIGKNKVTPNENAESDYLYCLEKLYNYVDYFVVNVSSPNTPGLRQLQEKKPLMGLLKVLKERSEAKENQKPIFLKIAPDLKDDQLDDIVDILKATRMDGVVATNTTTTRHDLTTEPQKVQRIGQGGLSGAPLNDRSNEVIKYLRNKLGSQFPIIGVGGIMNEDDALAKLRAGATLIQVYTGFVYEGPSFVKRLNRAILNMND